MNEKKLLLKNKFNTLISSSLEVKKYILIYFLILVFSSFTFFEINNYLNPLAEILFLIIIWIS